MKKQKMIEKNTKTTSYSLNVQNKNKTLEIGRIEETKQWSKKKYKNNKLPTKQSKKNKKLEIRKMKKQKMIGRNKIQKQ